MKPEPIAWIYQNANTEHQYLVWHKQEGGRNWMPLFTLQDVQDAILAEREACAKLAAEPQFWKLPSFTHQPSDRTIGRIEGEKEMSRQITAAIRARGEKPPVKSYCGGVPNYCTPVDNVNINDKRVHKIEKSVHEEKNG